MLEYSTTQHALTILDRDEKLVTLSEYSGQKRKTWFVTESGFFHLVIKSTKPEARAIRKWVTSVVLPLLRKGLYATEPISKQRQLTDEILKKWDDLKADIKIKTSELDELKDLEKSFGNEFFVTYRSDPHQLNLFNSESKSLEK